MARSNLAVTLSIRVSSDAREQLDELADATGRTKSFLAAEAIEHYLAIQSWQVQGIKNAVKKASSKDAKFIEHDKVVDWLESWGHKHEKDMPE
jgi:predicted transcriptional regulator